MAQYVDSVEEQHRQPRSEHYIQSRHVRVIEQQSGSKAKPFVSFWPLVFHLYQPASVCCFVYSFQTFCAPVASIFIQLCLAMELMAMFTVYHVFCFGQCDQSGTLFYLQFPETSSFLTIIHYQHWLIIIALSIFCLSVVVLSCLEKESSLESIFNSTKVMSQALPLP